MTSPAHSVAVVGAGTMGAGIAQVAATNGWRAVLLDVDLPTAQAGVDRVAGQLDRLVEKGKLSGAVRDAARAALRAGTADDVGECALLIEAIVEDAAIKASVLRQILHGLPRDAIVATNTSSLSVSALGEAVGCPQRFVGMHFFNPAPVMALVEIIAGAQTDPAVVDRAAAIAASWGKRVARAADVPGFIVNHVARPYYLEAFRILEDGHAGVDEVDRAMRELGGFRMGPLELTDLIGQDVNTATSRSVWQQLGRPPLLRPSTLQEQLVAAGDLGRKTHRGAYDYRTDPPLPALRIERRPVALTPELRSAVSDFVTRAAARPVRDDEELAEYIFARILAAIIAQAHFARDRGVASAADIDTALRYGTNYPKGPFEWTDQIGRDRCTRVLEALAAAPEGERFRVALA